VSLGGLTIGVVIPTRNEAKALPAVLGSMPGFVDAVAVGDYRSTDGTPEIGRRLGAVVVDVPGSGYGRACLAAIAALPIVDIIVFVDVTPPTISARWSNSWSPSSSAGRRSRWGRAFWVNARPAR
jgi:glycosyltransferase involved in cell wall biosynthesis